MRPRKHKFLYFVLIAGLLVTSCASGQGTPTAIPNEIEAQATPVVEYQVASSRRIFDTYEKLLKVTDLVVIGVVKAEDGLIIHGSRNAEDRSQPSEGLYGICTVYRVRLEQIIYGKAGDELLLCHGGGILPAEAVKGETPSESEIRQVIVGNAGVKYIPLEMGRRYLMFLHPLDTQEYPIDGYISNQVFGRAGAPWLFDLSDEKAVRAIDVDEYVVDLYPPRSLEEMIQLLLGAAPYPAP
jgi:hypothetical protein